MKLFARFFRDCAFFFDRRFFISVVAYAVFLVVVMVVAEAVEGRGLFMVFDGVMLERIIEARTDFLTMVMRDATMLGHWMVVWLFVAIIGLELAARRRITHFVSLLLSVGGASVVALALKQLLVRPRPDLLAIVSETTFSFPSGHSALSLAFYGILIYFLLRCSCDVWAKYVGVFAAVVVIALVGFSRIYLGVHWPSDVIGGYVLTAGWLYVVISQAEHIEKKKKAVKVGV